MASECPVCRLFSLALNKHLKHKHAVRSLEERGIILKMASGRINVHNEEEYPVHSPPFSPHAECDEEDCRQVMLEHVALRAQKDSLIDEQPPVVRALYARRPVRPSTIS
ncbi:hypothetical protein CgunFtcFv8_018856 [Champsocephalus gunnari]|uniref:Uncharacterized protein n=1 Tax=Champsocephalus gunnari TaxID=52237 RepID=A0AAN8DNX4_CHAGU|nr:hypothetical protein CgunFtcFv8_018856 [Champsocephalus gunnari]